MRSRVKWIVATLILAGVFHLLSVMSVPYAIMIGLSLKSRQPPNSIFHSEPVTAASRSIVRPSPDLLYSACGFDVSEKPLRITAPVPNTYYSISAFDMNTDNFFVINDRQVTSDKMEIVIKGPNASYTGNGKEIVVTAPSRGGVVLFRMLIEDRNKLDDLINIQKQATCSSIG